MPWLSLAVGALATGLLIGTLTHVTYGFPLLTENGGINLLGTSCGFEVWGHPGPFCEAPMP